MRFLSPGFLFALLAIAIPIIIHLFNFRRFKKVYFSNVRFLKEVQVQNSSRRILRDRLILLCRILAIAFLVLAFARPYIPGKDQTGMNEGQVISVFVDNSYSMEALNKEGTLLDEAKRRAREIAMAYGLNDKFQILTNEFAARDQRLLSREDFLNALEDIQIGPGRRDLSEIISRQEEVYRSEPMARKNLYVVSDLQRNMLPKEHAGADTSLNIRLVKLNATPQPNISIDSVWFLSAIHRPGETEQAVVKLRNNSDEKALNIPIRLRINSQQKALGSLSIEARGSATDTLSFSGLQPGWQSGELEISDHPMIFDNHFYFSFRVESGLRLLIVNGAAENTFLKAVYASDPFFKADQVQAGNINYSELASYPLIILNEHPAISEAQVQQLSRYVQQGGSLMVFPSLSADLSPLSSLLRALQADLPSGIAEEEAKTGINLRHTIFSGVFEKTTGRLELPVAKRFLKFAPSNTNREILLDLPGRDFFLASYRSGKGKLYLSAVPLNDESSNFGRHSLFVPIMYQAALQSVRAQDLYYQITEEQTVDIPGISVKAGQTLKLRKDKFEVIPDLQQEGGNAMLYVADQIREPGNYELLLADSVRAVLSFNDSSDESDLSYASEKELKQHFRGTKTDLIDQAKGSMNELISDLDRGISLWKMCIVLALISLAAEILLIRFLKNNPHKLHDANINTVGRHH